MKSTVLWSLVGLNAVLLFMFSGSFTRLNTAQAQVHRPADYLMIPGEINGDSTSVVYIIDSTNGKLGAMSYDDSRKQLQTMPAINLNSIYAAANPQR